MAVESRSLNEPFKVQRLRISPSNVVVGGVELLGSLGGADHVYDLVVPVVPDLDLVEAVPAQDGLPLLPGDEGGRVHGAAVADDQHVPVLGRVREVEERRLDLHHRVQQVLL